MKHKNKWIKNTILFIPRIFGLVKLYNWLMNKKGIFETKEVVINWLYFLVGISLLISVTAYSILTYDQASTSWGDLNTVSFSKTADGFGSCGFILLILFMMILPFKTYFKLKRVKYNEE